MVGVSDELVNVITVHPLLFVGGFIAHTAFSVLFTLLAAPSISAALSLPIATIAGYWLIIAAIVLTLGLIRQRGDN